MQRCRFPTLAAILLCCVGPIAPDGPAVAGEPVAAILNLTERDLSRLVDGALFSTPDRSIEGERAHPRRSVSDLHYRASIGEPVIDLEADGAGRLKLDIERADVRVGRVERKLLARRAFCENLGFEVGPDHPLGLTLDFRFLVENGELRIVPEDVVLDGTEDVHLRRPTRCRRTLLPEWLVWRIAKPRLARELRKFDERLLDSARREASRLDARGGLLNLSWQPRRIDGTVSTDTLRLFPQALDTSGNTLLLALSSAPPPSAESSGEGVPAWARGLAGRSFLGLSQSWLNAIAGSIAAGGGEPLPISGRNVRKLLRGDGALALLPGLRDVPGRAVELRWRLLVPPRIEIVAQRAGDAQVEDAWSQADVALLRIVLDGLAIEVRSPGSAEGEVLGTLLVEHASIGVLPYVGPLGGVSFEVEENDWLVSATGVEVDEELLAATLAEIVFAEVFESSYEPLSTRAPGLGAGASAPRYFRTVDGHLLVPLAGFGPGSMSQAKR